MGDAHEVLSYTVSADDRASAVFRGVGAEINKLSGIASTGLKGIARDMAGLSNGKPIEFVKADQALMLAKTEAEMAKLNKTMAASGVATKLESAEMGVLSQRHQQAQKDIEKTAAAHSLLTKAATVASYGILAAGAAVVVGAIKQGIAWEDLGKKIQQETGLSGKSLKDLMTTINNVTGTVPYKLGEVSAAAVLLKTKFGLSDPQIEKTAGLMAAFAKRAGEETTPAVTGLLSIMQDYREPLSDVVGLTDKLTSVSQATQKPMGELLGVVEKYGPKLQAMGFGLNESIKLLGIFQESGISTSMMGRGLSQAVTIADKQLGVTAANPHGNPQEALEKEALAVQKAEASVDKYNETIPKTLAQQNQLDRERAIASTELDKQREKYDSLKKSIEQNGGAHATIASIIKGEISQIEHAKSSQEAYSIAIADFGKQVGPSFERAFYKNEAAIKAVDKALEKHGATQGLVKAEEGTLEGQVVKLDEQWHKTERTLSTVLMPTVTEFLKLLEGGVTDIEKFTKGHASLSEILGAGAMVGAGAFLARKPIGAVASGAGSILSKVTGIGSTAASDVTGLHGYTGNQAMVGSRVNPVAVTMVGGLGGNGKTPGGAVAEDAGADAGASAAGISAAAIALGSIALTFKEFMSPPTKTVSPDAFKKDFEQGKPIPHAYGTEVSTTTYGVGPTNPQTEAERRYWETFQAAPGPATTTFGGTPAASGAASHAAIANTKAQVEANQLLQRSSKEVQEAEEELARMRKQGETGSANYKTVLKQLASAESEHSKALSDLAKAEGQHAATMRSQVEGNIFGLDSALASHPSSSTRSSVAANWKSLTGIVSGEMGAESSAVGKGVGNINKQLLEEVKALNGGKVASLAEGGPPLAPGVEKALTGHATGGRVPGPVGPDNWTLVDPSGRAAAKVGGSELLIANRHTEADASKATMAVYGKTLGQMVAGETVPHSMATGGRTHYDRLIEVANTVSNDNFPYKWGGGHEQPAHLEPFDCSGAVSYAVQQAGYNVPTEVSGQIGAWGFPGGPGEATIFYNPVHTFMRIGGKYWGTSGFARPGGGAGWFDEDPAANYLSGFSTVHLPNLGSDTVSAGGAGQISTPKWKGPGGVLGKIGTAALSKVTQSANARLATMATKAGATLGSAGGGQMLKDAPPDASKLTPTTFARDLLAMLGIQASGQAIADMVAWEAQEGGNWHNTAWFNPLNTTYSMPGAGNTGTQGNIKQYRDWDQGLEATAKTLANYPTILAALRHGTLSQFEAAVNASPWGTHFATGGRLNFAGAFGSGGSVTASSPTMAIFGDKGTETATFIPHAATGTRVGSSGLGETEGVNPETGDIEYHTQEEWAQIHLRYSSKTKKESLYKKAHPSSKAAKPSYEDLIKVGGLAAGEITTSAQQTFNLPGDIAKLSASVWAKIVAAIEKTLKQTGDDRVQTAITGKISQEHGSRAHALATKAIETSAKSVISNLKAQPEERGVPAGAEAEVALKKLMADARQSGNKALLGGLEKDLETTFKTTASRIMKTAESAPASKAAGADASAVAQLHSLAEKARKDGEQTMELALLKDVQKTVVSWHSAIGSAFSKAQKETTTRENLKIAGATLAEIHKGGAGARLKASAQTDPAYLKEEEANAAKAEKEYEAERDAIAKLLKRESEEIKKLQAKETKERKKHHTAAANAIEAQVRLIEAQLGEAKEQYDEVTTAIQETKINVAELQAEHEKAVEEALKAQIAEADQVFESHLSHMQMAETLEEGRLHREGLDFAGLEEDKTKQEGVLTPGQIAQANQDFAKYKQAHEEQIAEAERQKAYDISQLGGLSGEDRVSMEQKIDQINETINNLLNGIYDQKKATEKLTEATEQQTKQYGGTVGVNFNGQDYIVGGNPTGQSSNSGANIGVGV